MLVDGKLARVDSLCSTIEKVWGPTPEAFSASDLEIVRGLEEYLNKLFRGEFPPLQANLPKLHKLFLAKRCVSAVLGQQAQLRKLHAADSAKLIQALMDVIKPFPEEWRMLESTPAIANWIHGALPTDEQGVLAYLSKPASTFSDADAVTLLVRYVTAHGRLPEVTTRSERLWGSIASDKSAAGYAAPTLLVRLLGQLDAGSVKRILSPPHAGLDVVKGVAKAIGDRLNALAVEDADRSEKKRLVTHLRCVLDNAATDLSPQEFELLLRGSQELSGFYNPEKGAFGDGVSAFINGLRARPAQTCVDAEIIRTGAVWAECATDSTALQSQLTAWKRLLSWFAEFDLSGASKIPFSGSWKPVFDGVLAEVRATVSELVPGSDTDTAVITLRRNLLTTILSTYRQKGWLPVPGKGLLGFGGTKKDVLQDKIEELCKVPNR